MLVDREGIGSCVLFFLALPGPAVERLEVLGLTCGLIGEGSLEGAGELVADVFLFGWNFFAVLVDVADDSRVGFEGVEVGSGGMIDETAAVVSSTDSAVSCSAPETEVKGLSSIVTASCRKGRKSWGRCFLAKNLKGPQRYANGNESRLALGGSPVYTVL